MAARAIDRVPLQSIRRQIFSGIQPTGVPHLGNYLGALRPWVELQNSGEVGQSQTFCIVDLHALTAHPDGEILRMNKLAMMASFLAVGLKPMQSILFHQSSLSAHSELMWMLSCHASFGALNRMTQWKAKSEAANMNTSKNQQPRHELGLFSYPVLQAADILLHSTTHVPVGEDQQQHVEFARDLALSFNHIHKTQTPLLTVPEAMVSPARRIMSLTEPWKKMSKSDRNPASRILINDNSDDIHTKIKAALTDSFQGLSYEPQKRPGVSNLIEILSHLDKEDRSCEAIARDCENLSMRAFKEHVSHSLDHYLAPIRDKYESLITRESHLTEIARSGANAAKDRVEPKMRAIRKALGIES